MSKGSTPRPKSVSETEFSDNFARTFSREIDDPSGYDAREHYCPPSKPQHDLDAREQMRRDNLSHAEAVVLGHVLDKHKAALAKLPDQPPCHDWPSTDTLTHPDTED